MRTQKNLISLMVVTCLVLFVGMNPAWCLQKKYEETFEKTISIDKDGKVILVNISGDVEVKTWNRGEVEIRALKTSKTNSEEQAQKNFEKVQILIKEDGDTLRIETKYDKQYFKKSSKNKQVSVNYWLTIPDEASADAKSVSGDVTIENIGGSARGETVSGDVTLTDIDGPAKAKAISGDVSVFDAKSGADIEGVSGSLVAKNIDGDVDMKTVSGRISLESCRGDVEAECVSGDIKLIDITGADDVSVSALSGDVTYVGDLARAGSYDFKSHSGTVTLTLPANAAFDLEAKTFSGSISTDFEVSISGKLSKKSMKGSVNGGGADLVLKTFSGNVRIKKR